MAIHEYDTAISVDSFLRGVKYTNPLPARNSTPTSIKVTSVNTVNPMPHSAGPKILVPSIIVINPMIRFIILVMPVPNIFLNMRLVSMHLVSHLMKHPEKCETPTFSIENRDDVVAVQGMETLFIS